MVPLATTGAVVLMLLMTGRLHLPAAEVYSGGGGDAEECREQMRCRWSGSLAEAWTAGSIVERAVERGRVTAPLHEKRPTMEWSGDGQWNGAVTASSSCQCLPPRCGTDT